jgi:hypothetical protein
METVNFSMLSGFTDLAYDGTLTLPVLLNGSSLRRTRTETTSAFQKIAMKQHGYPI